jgi:hypothetical protein
MTAEDFVNAIRIFVVEPAASGIVKALEKPIMRTPSAESVAASNWYSGLSDEHRGYLSKAVCDAAHASVFGLLCVIDGVRVIESGPEKSEFRLIRVAPDGTETLLNTENGPFLHDILNAV